MEQYGNFYTFELHQAILKGFYISDSGVYLVVFRVLNKHSNVLVYNYIYYPDVFINSLLYYLLRKNNNFKNSMVYREWGDYLSVLDNRLGEGNDIEEVKEVNYIIGNNYFRDFYLNQPNSLAWQDYTGLFDIVKKMTHVDDGNNLESMVLLIDSAVKKDYFTFFAQVVPLEAEYKEEKMQTKDLYLLKDCMFVVKNLKELLSKLSKKGYIVNGGPQSQRDHLNSMCSFLSTVDIDFINNLFTQQLNSLRVHVLPSNLKLPKSKFSFKNIHMNIGYLRYYSTKRYISNKVLSNRQELFEYINPIDFWVKN